MLTTETIAPKMTPPTIAPATPRTYADLEGCRLDDFVGEAIAANVDAMQNLERAEGDLAAATEQTGSADPRVKRAAIASLQGKRNAIADAQADLAHARKQIDVARAAAFRLVEPILQAEHRRVIATTLMPALLGLDAAASALREVESTAHGYALPGALTARPALACDVGTIAHNFLLSTLATLDRLARIPK